MQQWICTICGYVHDGEKPPEVCPVCGAPASAFKRETGETTSAPAGGADTGPPQGLRLRALRWAAGHLPLEQLHPITVHFPNGLIPTSFLFLLIALVVKTGCVEPAAFYLVCAATIISPLAVATGIYTWCTRYKGAITAAFLFKLFGGTACTVLGGAIVIWRLSNPDVVALNPGMYVLLNIMLLTLVTLLGHVGGKLVFGARKRSG
jgi:uncharacterized membrane protein